jgi:hypothetical protein
MNDENANDDASATFDPKEMITLGEFPKFGLFCQALQENQEDLIRVEFSIPEELSRDHFSMLLDSLRANQTVQTILILIEDDAMLEDQDAKGLGNILGAMPRFTELEFYFFGSHEINLSGFWMGIAKSQTLTHLTIGGLLSVQGCVASMAQTFRLYPNAPKLKFLSFVSCFLGSQDTEALNELLGNKDTLLILRIRDCNMEDPGDMIRIANCMSENKFLRYFVYHGEVSKPTAAAFANMLSRNSMLRVVEFRGCCTETADIISAAISTNVTLLLAKLLDQNGNPNSRESELYINHVTHLNGCGRRFLQGFIQRPLDASLEFMWLGMVHNNIDNHAILYSCLRDYPSILVAVMSAGFHSIMLEQN